MFGPKVYILLKYTPGEEKDVDRTKSQYVEPTYDVFAKDDLSIAQDLNIPTMSPALERAPSPAHSASSKSTHISSGTPDDKASRKKAKKSDGNSTISSPTPLSPLTAMRRAK